MPAVGLGYLGIMPIGSLCKALLIAIARLVKKVVLSVRRQPNPAIRGMHVPSTALSRCAAGNDGAAGYQTPQHSTKRGSTYCVVGGSCAGGRRVPAVVLAY